MMNRLENPVFSLRAAAIIIKDGSVLICKNDSHACHYLPGGSIEKGESSLEAVLRELHEETGVHFKIDRLVYIQERFYTTGKIPQQEITFIYLMKDNAFSIPHNCNTDRPDEHLKWVPLDKLYEINIVPPFIGPALLDLPINLTHIITHN